MAASPLFSKALARRLLKIALVTTPLLLLFILSLATTQYYDSGADARYFSRILTGYLIGVQPWFIAAPLVVLVGYLQARRRHGLLAVAVEAVLLAIAVLGIHLLNLTFILAPHYGVSIMELLSSVGLRGWMWDMIIFVMMLLSGHLLGMAERRNAEEMARNSPQKILARSASRVDIVDIDDVIAASAQGNYVALITDSAEYLHRTTLAEMKDRLQEHGFVQVHRSHLVRAQSVSSIKRADGRIKELQTHNGRRFPVSAANQDAVSAMLQVDHIAA